MSKNGDELKNELQSQAVLEKAQAIISLEKRPESPLRQAPNISGGLLATYQRAVMEDKDIIQELKQGIWINYGQLDLICAALDELELLGLPFTPVLRRLAGMNAGVDGMRMKELLKAYSHITIGDNDPSTISKKGLFGRFGGKPPDPIG